MIIKGDYIKQVNKIGEAFDRVGDIFEVIDISQDGIITFEADYGRGVMTYDEFEKYFVKVEKRKWTNCLICDGVDNNIYVYKTNGKKVIVCHVGIKAKASCCPSDEFDLDFGIKLCIARIKVKKAQANVTDLLSQ